MPVGIIDRTGPGMKHIVGFGDQSTGRGTFGDEFRVRHCNQWGLTFAATRPSSQIRLHWANLLLLLSLLLLRYREHYAVLRPSSSHTPCHTFVSSFYSLQPRSDSMTVHMSSHPPLVCLTTPTTTTTRTSPDWTKTWTTRWRTLFVLLTFFSPTYKSASCSGSSVRTMTNFSRFVFFQQLDIFIYWPTHT